MKTINLKQTLALILIIAISSVNFAFAQDDTTKNKIIEKKIIIINDNIGDSDDTIDIYQAEKAENLELKLEKLEEELENLGEEIEAEIEAEMETEFGDDKCEKKCKKHDKFKGNWAGFEFGLNNFVVSDLNFDLPEESSFMDLKPNLSWGFALNLPEVSIPLFSRYTGFVSGLGLEWNNYRFQNNMDLVVENGIIVAQNINPEEIKYEKNTLNALYLNIPFIYELQIPVNKKDNRIFIGVGVVGGVKIASKAKKTYLSDNELRTIKNVDDYNLNPFKYGLTARFGFDDAQVFVNYSLSTLFEANAGPELYPVSAGLRINF